MTTFPLRAPHPAMRLLLSVLLVRSREVVVTAGEVTVRLGWGFRCTFPRSTVVSAARDPRRVVSIGAHGWRGRWLVNTSTRDLVTVTLEPPASARVVGVPVRVHTLTVSPADPDGLVAALSS